MPKSDADADDVRLIEQALACAGGSPFLLERATQLAAALDRLADSGVQRRAPPIHAPAAAVLRRIDAR